MSQEIYSPEGLRLDGRRWNELRNVTCQVNTHPHSSDGSSFFTMGNNKIITLVKGPHEPQLKSQLNAEEATLNISINITQFSKFERAKQSHKNERRVLELQTSLQRTFNKTIMLSHYPRTVIDIELHVLQQDGGILGSMINGITLALVDAGIDLWEYVCGINVGLYDATPLLDCNSLEENRMSCITMGVMGKTEKLSLLMIEDRIPLDKMENVLAIGIAGAHRLRDLMDQELRLHAAQRYKNSI